MIKRILIIIAIVLMGLSMFQSAFVHAAKPDVEESEKKFDKLESKKEKITKKNKMTEKEIDELILEIDLLTSEKESIEREIKRNERQIKKIEKDIKKVQAEIDELQERIDERAEIVGNRLISQQSNGTIDYLDVLFGSSGFMDFITRAQAVSRIVEADNEIIENFFKDIEIVEEKLNEVKEMKRKANDVKKENEEKKKELERNIKQTKRQKKELDKEIKKSKSNLKEIEEEQDKLIEKINKELGMKVGMGEGVLEWPTSNDTYVSSGVGQRVHPVTGKKGSFHKGIDIARKDKSVVPPVHAAEEGVVIDAGRAGGYGNMIKIKHDNGVETLYAHLSEIEVELGQEVRRGQTIGLMGTTGMSTGIHLHFEVYENGKLQNPLRYVN